MGEAKYIYFTCLKKVITEKGLKEYD